jgi:hypothetical protein
LTPPLPEEEYEIVPPAGRELETEVAPTKLVGSETF